VVDALVEMDFLIFQELAKIVLQGLVMTKAA
jgi:hypothetical protein